MAAPTIAGVIFAGGRARRFGGRNKALMELGGHSLLAHVRGRASGQVAALALSLAPDMAVSAGAEDLPLVRDALGDVGPLSGLAAALAWAEAGGYDWLATFPADVPFVPRDMVCRLFAASAEADVVMARSGEQVHFLCGLWRTALAASLPGLVAAGRRRVLEAAQTVRMETVDFPDEPADPFWNVNTEGDLAVAREWLASGLIAP